MEKVAANRLGKEVLKKWLSNTKTPSAQSFHNKVVDSLMGSRVHPKASGIDRVKFLARGGNETTGKAAMPKSVNKGRIPEPIKGVHPKVIPNTPKIQKIPAKATASNDNKYTKRIALGAGATAAVGAIGYGAYRASREK